MNGVTPAIYLTLKGHCIERAVKLEIGRLTAYLLEAPDAPDFEMEKSRLTLLLEFAEACDFKKVRAENPQLDGRVAIEVEIRKNASGLSIVIPPEDMAKGVMK